MTNWKSLIREAMESEGESEADVVSSTLSEQDATAEFNDGFGCVEGVPFTLWTVDRVYFPVCYDGSESVASVARNPDGKPTQHIGGG